MYYFGVTCGPCILFFRTLQPMVQATAKGADGGILTARLSIEMCFLCQRKGGTGTSAGEARRKGQALHLFLTVSRARGRVGLVR